VIPRYSGEDGTLSGWTLETPNHKAALHKHAFGQVAARAGVPEKYLNTLGDISDPWGAELAAHNVNTLLKHESKTARNLVREITDKDGTEIRGFVSDRFRRLDSRPLLDSFMGACGQIGAVPIEGFALDTKVRMRAILPYLFEPVANEIILFGLEWRNSDFGDGKHGMNLFCHRTWCTNMSTMEEVLGQVHLGKRLDDNISYSQRTYELDTQANASALKDVVFDILSPNRVNLYVENIKEAIGDTIGEKDITKILKAKLTKGEAEKVSDLFNGPDVQNLPPGHSTYRLSNAISFFAQAEGISQNRKLELQEIAGSLMPKMGLKAVEV
jgi:hypothetical protein